jgi:CHAT domain-containing protein
MAQQKGAKSVIATLWPVADSSTALLMETFYRIREEQGLPKAEALRQAQLSLLTGGNTTGTTSLGERGRLERVKSDQVDRFMPADPTTPFAHPYYWAPFVLMGNWL